MPAASPTTAAPRVFTVPHDGVIATKPATTPEAAPKVVGLPSRICSTASHPSMPRQPASKVLRKIADANPLAANAEPALNPNQPNQRSPTPRSTNGRWGGRMASTLKPMRGPTPNASPSPEQPEP